MGNGHSSHPTDFETVIYDLDGTLVDSAPVVASILNSLRTELGRPVLPQSNYYDWISLGGKALIVNALQISEADSGVYLALFREKYFELRTSPNTLYPNVVSTLAGLKRRGVNLSICTNKPRRLVDKVLRETALGEYFDYILAGDDLPTRKPNVENVVRCLAAMNAQPHSTLFVGDSTVDQESAQVADIPFAFFSNGYDDGVKRQEAFFIFNDHAHLLGSLFSLERIAGEDHCKEASGGILLEKVGGA